MGAKDGVGTGESPSNQSPFKKLLISASANAVVEGLLLLGGGLLLRWLLRLIPLPEGALGWSCVFRFVYNHPTRPPSCHPKTRRPSVAQQPNSDSRISAAGFRTDLRCTVDLLIIYTLVLLSAYFYDPW